ncbi:terminase small subunit [Staphylococcus saprophyticus]|uniref:terminase small subunit n=2 Tax=Staphylococcus saprophyticus TaxID=29385 RepID=UPI00076B8463|nr:terminase small subunit [Staphylococcus saprophyticus]AMG20714.1 terminase small subunit [Staphylococcus saprophyticus]MDW3861857.1 terminase small subunit [Staphylococcus saprophyticus]MDW3914121.1 terminase small subunit [Staphylococcus saprophyticus]MDW3924134.1 terminase small subunit [Staphylococcus saprophyticus]MDW3961894.1 terminase small subunit [Staphylococcus saprophyticus]
MKLTVKQQKFADEYIISGNATEAAIKAGYSKKTAEATASRLLRNVKVSEYINKRLKELKEERLMDIEEALMISASIARGEHQQSYTKIYNNLKDEVDKEITYTHTPRIEERQRSIEHILKVHGILNGRLANEKLEKEIQILQKKIEKMDNAENNSQESEIAKALIKLAGASDD